MKKILFTIVQSTEISKAYTALKSLYNIDQETTLYLITDDIGLIQLQDVVILDFNFFIKTDHDAYLFSTIKFNGKSILFDAMKPIVMRYILQRHQDAFVIFCDSRTYFFKQPDYIYSKLDSYALLLMPYFRTLEPSSDLVDFRRNFSEGLFNTGCFAANGRSLNVLNWWISISLTGFEYDSFKGLWGEQRYLDLALVYFPECAICRHMGYNIAEWNLKARKLLFKNKNSSTPDPIVSIQFTKLLVELIEQGNHNDLQPYLKLYHQALTYTIRQIN